MTYYYWDWYDLLIFIIVVFVVACVLLLINIIFIIRNTYLEKISPYECGFTPFGKIIVNFDIKYYLIAILFLLFDLELMFIIPWVASFNSLNNLSFLMILFFILTLVIGFFYEWQKGGIEWN